MTIFEFAEKLKQITGQVLLQINGESARVEVSLFSVRTSQGLPKTIIADIDFKDFYGSVGFVSKEEEGRMRDFLDYANKFSELNRTDLHENYNLRIL